MNTRCVRVALDVPLFREFDFLAPDAGPDDVGRLAVVPFGAGGRRQVGLITAVTDTPAVAPAQLKPVELIQRALPALSDVDFALLRFCAGYYHHPLGPIALHALPPALRAPRRILPAVERAAAITPLGRAALPALGPRAVAQHALLADLLAGPQAPATLKARHPRAAATLALLARKGWIAWAAQAPTPRREPGPRDTPALVPGPDLNAGQAAARDAIAGATGFSPFLLAGITGSGKTEVYLHAIADCLARGRQALVLLPEINLTPQFLRHLASRFPGAVIAPQHSGLAALPRMAGYLAAQRGEAHIVVGTRLAVFTPMPALGLIIVDEEHDPSFKQQEGVRYSARDVAVFRAREAGCPVVLGSATPSLESIANAARGRFRRLTLDARATPGSSLPAIEFIDLARERARDGLTARLVDAIDATVKRGEQALVFINRRGYAPALVCAQCGHLPHCRRCSARMVYHRAAARLRCHHCGDQARVPAACPDCGSHDLIAAGEGTERIEATLAARLPAARIARVDRDSTRRRGAAEKIFDAAAAGDIDVLVGTQMLSKGHDFPRITLVGVVNADAAMFAADFRAAERLVAQLMQVAGRAGRAGLPGRVLVQTRLAAHPLYAAIAAQDHARFAEIAFAERQACHLPPFTHLTLLRAEAKAAEAVDGFLAAAVASAAGLAHEGVTLWDPVPAALNRKAGFERRQLMVQSPQRARLHAFLDAWLPAVADAAPRGVRWSLDVDPQEV